MLTNIRIPDEQTLESFGFLYNKSLNYSHTRIIFNVG